MTQPCPRFASSASIFPGLVPGWLEVGSCSYCGSMEPAALFEAITGGAEIYATSRNNQLFVRYIEIDPETGRVGETPTQAEGMFQFEHFSESERTKFVQLLNDEEITFGYPGHFTILPFFVQQAEGGSFEIDEAGEPQL